MNKMARQTGNIYTDLYEKRIKISKLLKSKNLPIVVRACLKKADVEHTCQNVVPNLDEVFLQSIVHIKYALIKVLTFHNKDNICDEKGEDYVHEHNKHVGKQYLIPVKYNGKLNFVHRPGSRRRYASVSQVLDDPPRYLTVCEDTRALLCTPQNKYVSVPAKASVEVIRKVTRSSVQTTYLECSDGQNLLAFGEHDRLNCTAVDDTKQYNLFELVRTKLLPRVIQFHSTDPDDISHADETLNIATLSVVEGPVELQGFVDRELLVGWIRNEVNQSYETVLIPQTLWQTLYVDTSSLKSQTETPEYIERFYGPCDSADFVEKSLYLMSLHQDEVLCLVRSDFKESIFQGPVVLLPQVKKKQSLFKKVHTELLRWFMSGDNEESRRRRNRPGRKATISYTKLPNRKKMKNTPNRISRSASLSDMRFESKHMNYSQRVYGAIPSYIEFNSDCPDEFLSNTRQKHGRLSMSLDNIACKGVSQSDCSQYNAITGEISPEETNLTMYSEIVDNPMQTDNSHHNQLNSTTASANAHLQSGKLIPSNTETNNMQIDSSLKHDTPASGKTENEFYNYSIMETVECLTACGLHEFAGQCEEHKLDGAFFRNLDFGVFKGDPVYLSNFNILKLKKVILDGWRPS